MTALGRTRGVAMLMVAIAAIGADSVVVALIVGALVLEQVYRVGTDGVFDATLGIAIVFVLVAGLIAAVVQAHRHIRRAGHAGPPHFLT